MEFFKEIALFHAKKQAKFIDAITNQAPILATMPVVTSTHGLQHSYEKLTEITGPSLLDVDAPLPTLNVDSELGQVNLKVLGGKIDAPYTAAKQTGGIDAYFDRKTPPILRSGAATAEASIIDTIKQYAIENENYQRIATSGTANSSLLVVTWVEDETTGLIDPTQYNAGSFFEMESYWGGNVGVNSAGQSVYSRFILTHFGMLLSNPRHVAGVFNITTAAPLTAKILDDALLAARVGEGMTMIYCSPKIKNQIKDLKTNSVSLYNSDMDIFQGVEAYDGVPIITSFNYAYGTEALVPAIS